MARMLARVQSHPPQRFPILKHPARRIDKSLLIARHRHSTIVAMADVLRGSGLVVGDHAKP